MKTITTLFIVIGSIASNISKAQEIKFVHATWNEVLKKAQAENKYIFVDFYATWCGPCKYMTKDVFTAKISGDYFNKNFISFKVDAEKEEQTLVESINLEAYPTLGFFDAKGEILFKHVGAVDENELVALGEKVMRYKNGSAKVLSGEATRSEIIDYLAIAKTADTENFNRLAPPVVMSFTITDLENESEWSLFSAVENNINSTLFQAVIENSDLLSEKHDDFLKYVENVLQQHLDSMVEAGNLKGLDIYKTSLRTLYAKVAKKEFGPEYFELQINAEYYLIRGETLDYAKTLTEWVNKYHKNDWEKLKESAIALSKNVKEKQYQDSAIHWAKAAIELEKNKYTLFGLSVVYRNVDDKQKAIASAEEILKLELDEEEKTFIKEYIEELRG